MSLKAVHYINQFYAGIGGETMADTGFGILDIISGSINATTGISCGSTHTILRFWALSSFGMEK